MRTEEEMFQLIMDVAKQEEHIRAVGMVGSRTNVKAPKDSFQDFDIVYIVEPCAEFFETATWIAKFWTTINYATSQGNDLISHRTEDAGNIFNVI